MGISYTQNGITFGNIINGEGVLPSKYGNANNGDFSLAQYTGIQPFVNAVEIDWNGAEVPLSSAKKTTINTTADLLSTIGNISSETKDNSFSIANLNNNNENVNTTLSYTKDLTYTMLKNNKFGISVDHFDIAYNSYGGGSVRVVAYIPKSDLVIGESDIKINWQQYTDNNVKYNPFTFIFDSTKQLINTNGNYYECICYVKDLVLSKKIDTYSGLKVIPHIVSDYYYQTSYKSAFVPLSLSGNSIKLDKQCYYVGNIDPSDVSTGNHFISINNSDDIYSFTIDETLMEEQQAYTTTYYNCSYFAIRGLEKIQSPIHIITPSTPHWTNRFTVVDNDGNFVKHTSVLTGTGPNVKYVAYEGSTQVLETTNYIWKVYENIGKEYHIKEVANLE